MTAFFKDVPVGNYFAFEDEPETLYVKDSKTKIRVFGDPKTKYRIYRRNTPVVDEGSEIRPEWFAQPVINRAD